MQIFCDQITPRLQYTVDVLLNGYADTIHFSTDLDDWLNYEGPKLSYCSTKPAGSPFHIVSAGLINEVGITTPRPEVSKVRQMHVLFPTKSHDDFPFDIFSATFYMLSRYEEYQEFQGDHMQRFEAEQSLAFQSGFLKIPVVDQWRIMLIDHLKRFWPAIRINVPVFKCISTVDIDSAFAFRHKGVIRTLGGISKDVFTLKISNFRNRLNFLLNSERDPYDTFSLMETLHKQNNTESIFFFLLADFGKYDKSVSYLSEALRQRISHVADVSKVGIHPGVASNKSVEILSKERIRLEKITGKSCDLSRQHYLVMKFPETYRRLVQVGISHDYTMGFASSVGFRAGTSFPFPWYDLADEKITGLTIHPFTVMDATLRYYLRLNPGEAIDLIKEMKMAVREVNGTFVSLWHNESLSEIDPWLGWRKVFEEMLKFTPE